jgi:hypothetical protein
MDFSYDTHSLILISKRASDKLKPQNKKFNTIVNPNTMVKIFNIMEDYIFTTCIQKT